MFFCPKNVFLKLINTKKTVDKNADSVLCNSVTYFVNDNIFFVDNTCFRNLKTQKKTVRITAVVCPCNNVTKLCTRHK